MDAVGDDLPDESINIDESAVANADTNSINRCRAIAAGGSDQASSCGLTKARRCSRFELMWKIYARQSVVS